MITQLGNCMYVSGGRNFFLVKESSKPFFGGIFLGLNFRFGLAMILAA